MAYDKVVDSAALDGALTNIADAIRSKTGGTEPLTMEGMAAAISGIQTGGNEDGNFSALVDGTMTDFVATNQMQGVRANAFNNYKELRSADLTNIGTKNGALHGLIDSDAFAKCTNLERITLPTAAAEATAATQWIFSRAFSETAISEFATDYPGLFGYNAVQIFRYCPKLLTVRMPNFLFGGSFEYFDNCSVLELVEFGGGSIGTNVFRNCASLNIVIIRSGTVATLSNVNAFTGVTGPVNIYVNEALIEDYRAATNWASLYSSGIVDFVAIEGSEHE